MKIGTKDVQVFGRSISDLTKDIASEHPTPDSLKKASVSLSTEEEAALDAITGMMWPALIASGLSDIYHAQGHRQFKGIAAQITFPEDRFALTFRLE